VPRKRSLCLEVCCAVCLGILPSHCAAQAASAAAVQQPAAAPAGQNLANWWRMNSLDFKPMPRQWLGHVDVTLAYTNAQGNTTGSTFNGKIDFSLRKWRFTARSTGWLQKQNITYGFNAGSAHVTQNLLREQGNFDITKHTSLIGGVEDYTFTLIFMNDRFTEYGAFGVEAFKRNKQKLSFVGALGYSEFQFNSAGMLSIPSPIIHAAVLALPTTSPSGGGAMIMQAYSLELPHKLTVTQSGNYMKFFNSYLGHQGMINANFDVPIVKHVSFSPGYQLIDQDNRIIDALGVKTQDRLLTAGAKLSW